MRAPFQGSRSDAHLHIVASKINPETGRAYDLYKVQGRTLDQTTTDQAELFVARNTGATTRRTQDQRG
jgi:hypothetical protein